MRAYVCIWIYNAEQPKKNPVGTTKTKNFWSKKGNLCDVFDVSVTF